MNIVQCGPWKLNVDLDKTKAYYDSYTHRDTQANRNFAVYCKYLSAEEQAFFSQLAINPLCCDIEHIGTDSNGNFPCGGHYFVCGEYLEAPKENVMLLEDFVETGFIDDTEDDRITIGLFQFDFQQEENLFKEIPEDMPEGFICINFWCEDMKWLLDEDPEEKMYEPPKFWEIHKIIKRKIDEKRYINQLTEESKTSYLRLFDNLHIDAKYFAQAELKKYKKAWIKAFVPKDTNMRDIRKQCFPRGYTSYLWHLFSFEILPCEINEIANTRFDQQCKSDCILVSNIDEFAFCLKNANTLTAEHLEQFEDVTITDMDFTWTYSKTHEELCGPYFYQK